MPKLKILIAFLLAFSLLATPSLGWLDTDPPEGHIEATTGDSARTGYFKDGDYRWYRQSFLTTIYGTAHKNGEDQADADSKLDRYEIWIWADTNQNWEADSADDYPAWVKKYTADISGGEAHAIGWDCSPGSGQDDGTEGNLLQNGAIITVDPGFYLIRIRVVDVAGNTNTTKGGVDIWSTVGANAYTGQDGRAAIGLEDDEVVAWRRNRMAPTPTR